MTCKRNFLIFVIFLGVMGLNFMIVRENLETEIDNKTRKNKSILEVNEQLKLHVITKYDKLGYSYISSRKVGNLSYLLDSTSNYYE